MAKKKPNLPVSDSGMKKLSSSRSPQISVNVGGDVSGKVNVAGRDMHITEGGMDAAALEKLFDAMFQKMATLPNVSPQVVADVKPMVEEIKTEALKGDKADEGVIASKLRVIAAMAPDILDVVTATLANPVAGIGVAIQKIAKKAREEKGLK